MSDFTEIINEVIRNLSSDDINNENVVLQQLSSFMTDQEGCQEFLESEFYIHSLRLSAGKGYLSVMQYIWDKMPPGIGIDEINPKDSFGSRPLTSAAFNGHLKVVQAILDKMEQNINIDEYLCSSLFSAACNGHTKVMQAIWEKMGPNVSVEEINPKNKYQSTPLHLAASNGHLNVVQAILDKIGPLAIICVINPADHRQETPLHQAAMKGHLDIVHSILNKIGSNAKVEEINPKNNFQQTPLLLAFENGHLSVAQAILDKMHLSITIDEANPEHLLGNTPLHFAAANGDLGTIQSILDALMPDANIDLVNPKNKFGCTPLHYAAANGRLKVVQLICDKLISNLGVFEISAKDNHQKTALHYAADKGNVSVVQAILDKMWPNISIDEIHPEDFQNYTPLHYAADNGYLEVVRVILEKIVIVKSVEQVNPKHKDKVTPLEYAFRKGHLAIVQAIWDKLGLYATIQEINPSDRSGNTTLHYAAGNGQLKVVQAILNKLGPNVSIDKINPKGMAQETPLHFAARNGHFDVAKTILDKMGPNEPIEVINPKNVSQVTPLHLAARNGYLTVVQAILEKMGPWVSIDELNPKDDNQITPLHHAAENGYFSIVQAIWAKMGPNASLDEFNPEDEKQKTPLHFAAEKGHLNILRAIWEKMGPNAGIDLFNPKRKFQSTPLRMAADSGHIKILQAIWEKIGPYASTEEINPKDIHGKTPLYQQCESQRFKVIHMLLDNELVEVNNAGPSSLFTFFTGNDVDSVRVRNRLRLLGCIEIRKVIRDATTRLVQDGQGVHSSAVEKSILSSLEKLRVGKDASAVTSSYEDFIQYCNLSNSAFVDDLRAIEINSQNFSRNLIVKALSVTDAVSEQEKVELEKSKLSLFNDAIAHRIHNMTLSSNSADFVKSFKERLGLIWGELSNPECWHKFTDLKEIMDKEGEAFSRGNPSTEFKLALQKLRNVLFIQLIETRYEYAAGVNTNSKTLSRAQYLDALERSGPSCAGGTNNFIIECFSLRHNDIEVLAGQFTPDFTPDATLPIRIASKLYELILASVNTRSEVQIRVDSEIKIQPIEGISIVNELLDRMAGASDKVKKVLPQDTILLEERIREYFRTGSIPGHSRAIGLLLGLLKQTLQENQDIIGGLILQPNQTQIEALTEAFRHLEQALANSQPGFLTQALTEARSQYYQSFFKDDLDQQKLNQFLKILQGNETIDIEERGLIQTTLIDRYGDYIGSVDLSEKVITPKKIEIIHESIWYRSIYLHLLGSLQAQSDALIEKPVTGSGNSLNSHKLNDDLILKIDSMLGLKSNVVPNRSILKRSQVTKDDELIAEKAFLFLRISGEEKDESDATKDKTAKRPKKSI